VKVCSAGIWFMYRTSAYPLMDSAPKSLLPTRKPLPGLNSPQVSMGSRVGVLLGGTGLGGAEAGAAVPPTAI